MKPVTLHPEALAEFSEAAASYASVSVELADSFIAEVERTVCDISFGPKVGRLFATPARRRLLRRFPYAIVYLEEENRCVAVAVMHLHRHPRYWVDRLS